MASPLTKNPTLREANRTVTDIDFDVSRFGAKGGLVGAGTDFAAINQAILAAGDRYGGGTILIPPGVYSITSNFSLSSSNDPVTDNITVSGSRGISVLQITAAGQTMFGIAAGDKVTVQNLHIDGNSQTGAIGISISGTATEVLIQNCVIEGCVDGISITGGTEILITNNVIQSNSADGIDIDIPALATATDIIIANNIIKSNTTTGIRVRNSGTLSRVLIDGNIANGNGTNYDDTSGVPTTDSNIGIP